MKESFFVIVVICVSSAACGSPSPMGTSPSRDAMPEVVVQRFVDAANARDANAMAALVAPDAVFSGFPGGQVIAQNRDRIQEHYSRLLQSLPPGFRITVQPRIVDGQIVIDQEHFTGMPAEQNQATWMYLGRDGLIHHAWSDGKLAQRLKPPTSRTWLRAITRRNREGYAARRPHRA